MIAPPSPSEMIGVKMMYICEFEFFEDEGFILAVPFGLGAGTQGHDMGEALEMAADWLTVTVQDYLIRGEEPPKVAYGNAPIHGGRVIAVAVNARIEDVPAMSASMAARKLGVSTARVAQLCNSGALESWRVGSARMISEASVLSRFDEEQKAGRPRKAAATV